MGFDVNFGDNTLHHIKGSKINLIFNTCPKESNYLNRLEITYDYALNYYNQLEELDTTVVEKLFRMVIRDYPYEFTKNKLNVTQEAWRALAGRLECTVRCMIQNIPFMWKYPESGLHPKHQLELADVVILLSEPKRLVELIKK